MANFGSGVGLIPEQDWELPDLAPSPFGTTAGDGLDWLPDGDPAGSAAPLTWSAASYVRMLADLGAGRNVLELPASPTSATSRAPRARRPSR